MRVGWVLAVILFFVGSACFTPRSHPELSFVRTYDAPVDRLLLIYTFTAEMSVYSLVDILRALPETDVVVISQFVPASAEFEAFVRILNSDSLGFRADGRPRLQFLQNASSFGPWPRDQMLVEEDGSVWISRRDQHGLRPIFLSLQMDYGLALRRSDVDFIGANLLPAGNNSILMAHHGTQALAPYIEDRMVRLQLPDSSMHLDLVVMPLDEQTVMVGDDEPARAALLALSDSQIAVLVDGWINDYIQAAANVRIERIGEQSAVRRTDGPELIRWPMLRDKLHKLAELRQAQLFRRTVQQTPAIDWDDRIAQTLRASGYRVIRVPYWPRRPGLAQVQLPMLCYSNSLVWQGGVLMPVYGIDSLDRLAAATIEAAVDKPVYPVRGGVLLGNGSSGVHCITLEL